jgi:energy-coupling factor transporter ATP-binding protein EcfA2
VLRGVAAGVEPGEAVLVTGRNGAGKSTLLQVVAGLLPTSRGSVLNRPSIVGWVPERFPVRQPFTAGGYLEGVARVRGLGATDARAAIDRWVDRLDLGPSLNTRLAELSKGSAQKVNLVQALLVRPSLLVMDEPWEGLDAPARRELPLIIDEVTAAGGSCVFSDHRGEAGVLPGVRRWYLDDGLLTEPDSSEVGNHVIEVVVPAADSAATVSQLRAAGHDVRAVRREKVLKPTGLKRPPTKQPGTRPSPPEPSAPEAAEDNAESKVEPELTASSAGKPEASA